EYVHLIFGTQQVGEHVGIAAISVGKRVWRNAGLEHSNLHSGCLPPQSASANAEKMEGKWLEGRHALITGGGTGIGASTAAHLHAAGAKVSLLGRRMEPLERTAAIVSGKAIQCDVADRTAIARAF